MENIWRYTINQGESGGIVIAKSYDEAVKKIKEAFYRHNCTEIKDEIVVWQASNDDDYDKAHPDVLRIYC